MQELFINGNPTIYLLGLAALAIGSATDMKTREVPDWVSYGLMISAAAARIASALAYENWNILVSGVAGFLAFVAVAYLMFYTGQWGGGDAKLLMGLGMVFGINFDMKSLIRGNLAGFLANVLVVGSIYGLVWSVYIAAKNRKKFFKEWKAGNGRYRKARVAVIAAGAVMMLGTLLAGSFLAKLFLAMLSLFSVAGYYLFLFIKAVEKACMYKKVRPDELTEGDWIAEDVIIEGKKITGPDDLGISAEQIKELKNLASEGKIKRVLIKEGIPFVPSFLIAYIIQLTMGSILEMIRF